MDEPFKQLSAQQLARLIQYAEGGDANPDDGARLHAEKNAPWINGAYSHLRFPAPALPGTAEFQPYPKTLFNGDYARADEQYRNALRLRARRGADADVLDILREAQQVRDECMRTVANVDEENILGPHWQETPAKALAMREQLERSVAQAAAESAFDDRTLGALARRERETADAASEGHLVEVPRTPIAPKTKKAD